MQNDLLPFVITTGEPAGIGPDLIIELSAQQTIVPWFTIVDPELLMTRARLMGRNIKLVEYNFSGSNILPKPQHIYYVPLQLAELVTAQKLNVANVPYVVNCLEKVVIYCQQKKCAGVITGPVHKGIIQQAGIPFTGQTEFIAQLLNCAKPVMMLCSSKLRVALLTTHLSLKEVPAQVTRENIMQTIQVLARSLQEWFDIAHPRIAVCGLNPHAGEGGAFGDEEIKAITPALTELRHAGFNVLGPLSADTAFTPATLAKVDVVLAMYHDQGLPVLKYSSFGEAVNVTLGLPIIRTSVDHGTALELAGLPSGRINIGSLHAAIRTAEAMHQHHMMRVQRETT